MAISLSKGGNISLSKESPGIKQIRIGLGWDARVTTGQDFDLDASVFLLNADDKCRSDSDFIFYNQEFYLFFAYQLFHFSLPTQLWHKHHHRLSNYTLDLKSPAFHLSSENP